MELLTTFLGFFLLLILITSTGNLILLGVGKYVEQYSVSFRLGAAYFLGISATIVFFRIFSLILSDIHLSAYLLVSLFIAFNIYQRKFTLSFFNELFEKKSILIYSLIGLALISIILLGLGMPIVDSNLNWMASLGSLHSEKYAWVSNYINSCQQVPVLGQNTGHSILTSIANLLFGSHPYLFLYLWLVFSVFFLSFFTYGFLALYIKEHLLILGGVLIFMLGNTALSFTHVLVIDSGSPFAFNGYTDTLLGVFSIFSVLILFYLFEESNKRKLWVVLFIILSANFFVAPQNIVLFLLLLFLLIVTRRISKQKFYFFGSALLLSTIISIPQGGMLTPSKYYDNIAYIGIMSPYKDHIGGTEKGITIHPGYQFHYDGLTKWRQGQNDLLREGLKYKEDGSIMAFLWTIERIVVNSFIVLFFPILGLFGIWMVYKKNLKNNYKDPEIYNTPPITYLLIFGVSAFAFGLFINLPFSLNGYKWELTRFMIPGIAFGMVSFYIFLENITSKYRKGKAIMGLVVLFMVAGPLITQTTKSVKNLVESDLSYKINALVSTGPYINDKFCKK